MRITISRWLSSTTYSCMCTWIGWLTIVEIHSGHVHHHIVLTSIILIIETYITVINLDWVTTKSSLTSFSHFSLSYIFWDLIVTTASNRVLRWIKERIGHHHLLLICVRSFSLVGQVENLLLSSNSSIGSGGSNSIIIAILSIRLNNFICVKIILISFIALVVGSILTTLKIAIIDLLMSR